jgi:hypothetical protein
LELTQGLLDPFIGGQARLLDLDHTLYWGQIDDIVLGEHSLVIRFAWLAKKPDHTTRNYDWVLDEGKTEHRSNTSFFLTGRLQKDQLIIKSPVTHECIVLLPQNYKNKLEIDKVSRPIMAS